jgi:hypothetical protein
LLNQDSQVYALAAQDRVSVGDDTGRKAPARVAREIDERERSR